MLNTTTPLDPSMTVALTTLETPEQKSIVAQYLISCFVENVGTSYFDLDATLFRNFIEFAEQLTNQQRLALAISLVMDVLLAEQEVAQTADRPPLLPVFSRTIRF